MLPIFDYIVTSHALSTPVRRSKFSITIIAGVMPILPNILMYMFRELCMSDGALGR